MNFVKKVVILSFFPLLFSSAVNAEQFKFTRNLMIGMVGEDVRQLQIFLNKDSDTKVADAGIGSFGQESTYFGSLTQKAVARYQEKYRDFILKPNGLTHGTGFVGQSTRDFIARSNLPDGKIPSISVSIATSTTKNIEIGQKSALPTPNVKNSGNFVGSGPNYENITTFVSSIEKIAKKKGFSEDKIALIKEEIYKGVATTTDLKAEFMKIVQEKNKKTSKSDSGASLFSVQFEQIVDKIFTTLYPKRVSAATGIPFGGALLFAFPCSCSDTWLLTLEPLPPTGVVLLDYIEGSQAFLSYNIPFTNWLLGEYIAGAGECFTGYFCSGIPAEGLITPMVGSSLE